MRSPAISLLRAFPMLLLVVLALLAASVAPAVAIERDPTYEDGPRTPFLFGSADQDTADLPGLPATAATGGLFVVGDSTSLAVPFVQRAAEDGVRLHLQAGAGWTVRFHQTVTGWPSSGLPSLDAARTGDAAAVYVALGTNDVGCLEPFVFCPETPELGTSEYEQFGLEERAKITEEIDRAATQLLDAGKCVLWAGPRPGNNGYAPNADVEALNEQLRGIADENPGRFTYVDYAAFSDSNPALRADFADPNSDGIHPQTVAGRAAIADLAVASAKQHCPVVSEPRVAVSPPLPPPPPPEPVAAPPVPEPVVVPPPPLVVVPPAPAPKLVTGCAAKSTGARRRTCRRALAVRSCARFRTASKRSPCMKRVRRLYGASAGEKRALRTCAKRSRTRRARCRATTHRRYRYR